MENYPINHSIYIINIIFNNIRLNVLVVKGVESKIIEEI